MSSEQPPGERHPTALKRHASEVVAYDRDPKEPGKPLHLVIPAGFVALGALGLAIYVSYERWYLEAISDQLTATLLAILLAIYVVSVFLFSYGYRLYDMRRAILLTLVIVFFGVAIVAILAAIFVVIRKGSFDLDLDLGGDGDDREGGGLLLGDLLAGDDAISESYSREFGCQACGSFPRPARGRPCSTCGHVPS
jgi:hypothetical protein